MKILSISERLNRQTFWMYAVPLVIGHIVVGLIGLSTRSGGLGGFDIVILLWLARIVGGRFRDIGWRPWIGMAFVLLTMIALPLVATGIAIAIDPRGTMDVLGWVGLVAGPLNLSLIAVAGSVPGQPDDGLPAHPSALAGVSLRPRKWEIAGAAAMVLIFALAIARMAWGPSTPVSRVAPPLPASYATIGRPDSAPVAGNGLTRETNDFLRQFSAQAAQGGRPAPGTFVIAPPPPQAQAPQ